jgi:hypothetical protein
MKTWRRAGVLTALSLASTAATCGAHPPDCTPQRTIVFLDLSASASPDSAVVRALRTQLPNVVEDALVCKGDRIDAFPLHAATRGKSIRARIENDLTPDTLYLSNNRKRLTKARFARAMSSLRRTAVSQIAAMADSANRRLGRSTDILGSLEVISEEVGDFDGPVSVYYFSDMNESMSGAGRRDFDMRSPHSAQEAQSWALTDTAVLKAMNVSHDRFRRVRVRVRQGSLANRSSAPNVNAYWRSMFTTLRVADISFNQ